MISSLIKTLFYRRTDAMFTDQETAEFELMLRNTDSEGSVRYESKFPKYRFIDYVVQNKNMVVHGSNRTDIDQFEVRRQTLFNGQPVEAVFASKDGIWSIFYAILDRSKVVYNFRNGCIKTASDMRYYFFSLTEPTYASDPWTTGSVYFLPADAFERTTRSKAYFDEWVCRQRIHPVMKLSINKEDFVYLNKVAVHKPNESIALTWLLYKFRTRSKR
ncbi:hypothetical protein [Cohnella yongneupensis]|uniref:Uncharacterized protein n=1 Tax=Cohnella yongneupensis TaxID=425006 RepID=A0ABW0QXK8_9BACL